MKWRLDIHIKCALKAFVISFKFAFAKSRRRKNEINYQTILVHRRRAKNLISHIAENFMFYGFSIEFLFLYWTIDVMKKVYELQLRSNFIRLASCGIKNEVVVDRVCLPCSLPLLLFFIMALVGHRDWKCRKDWIRSPLHAP